MKLEHVVINNFRQYFGEQETLKFSKAKEKNVTLVYGLNGAGKSNLFKAINWCLYGDVVFSDEGIKKGIIVNKEAFRLAAPQVSVVVSVEVAFIHKGEQYILKRSRDFVKETREPTIYRNDNFSMFKITNGRAEEVLNPLGQMNVILPENVRNYFLFDGERIENFAKPSSASDVRNAVYKVLKLEILQRAKEHLDDVAKEIRKELRSLTGAEVQELIDKYDAKKDFLTKLSDEQKNLNEEILAAEIRVKEYDNILESMKDSRDLQIEREKFEKEKFDLEQEKALNQLKLQKLATASITVLDSSYIQAAVALLDERRTKGEIPSKIRQQFLQDIIDSGTCICGRDFEKDSNERRHLVNLQTRTVSGILEQEVIELSSSLRTISREAANNRESLRDIMKRQMVIRDRLDIIDTEISEIGQKLKDSRIEDVEKTEKCREEYQTDIRKNIGRLAVNEQSISQISQELRKLFDEIEHARKNEKAEVELAAKMKLAQSAADAINNIYNQFADEMRVQIEERTEEIFKGLVWKESQFSKVKLGTDFHLEVYDRWNQPASPELSAGERQVLSLAFITAMAKESGEEAPIVMDTPFGRLSKEHRKKITKNIPELADQLVLFLTDEEMSEEMFDNIRDRVGEIYKLSFDDKTGCTTITKQ